MRKSTVIFNQDYQDVNENFKNVGRCPYCNRKRGFTITGENGYAEIYLSVYTKMIVALM